MLCVRFFPISTFEQYDFNEIWCDLYVTGVHPI